MRLPLFYIPVLTVTLLTGCLNGGSSSGTSATATDTTEFPTGLAVSSPTDVVASDATPALAAGIKVEPTFWASVGDWLLGTAHAAAGKVPRYTWATLKIDALLNGTTPASTTFTPDLFLATDTNAGCFGPTLDYTDHPDAATPNSGQLPSGDLGIWTETDATTGHACAAAELNSRMRGIGWRSNMALMGLASMIEQLTSSSTALPTAGNTVDATTLMNGLGVSSVTFTNASLSLDATGSIWTYVMDFTYVDGSSVSHDISIKLVHTPGASSAAYSGLLTYAVGDLFTGGNCPGTGSKNVTHIGTLKYTRASLSDMVLIHRSGQYCGHGDYTTLASFQSDGQLDPAGKWDGSTGWADNFSRFGADYDPTSLQGYYLYGWQAGYGDSNTRLFSVGLNAPPSAGQMAQDGEAYFGYGDEISVSNGDTNGMYCSWAAPGSTHTLQSYAQRQFISYDAASYLWTQPTGGSDILYAPTNDCTYDGSGTFWYDRNLNTAIDEGSTDLIVGAVGSALTPELDLMQKGTSADIPTKIASRGYVKPSF